MSLSSWKKEFYKTPADEVSKRFALKHSIRKWIGLLSVNRRKHNVSLDTGQLHGNDSDEGLYIDGSTCALCQHHNTKNHCSTCPVVITTGKTCHKAYESMFDYNRVKPMIDLLKRALVKKTNK